MVAKKNDTDRPGMIQAKKRVETLRGGYVGNTRPSGNVTVGMMRIALADLGDDVELCMMADAVITPFNTLEVRTSVLTTNETETIVVLE